MVRGIIIFILLWACVAGTITAVRTLTGKEKWELTKLVGYSMMCALVAIVILSGIVVVF